MAGPKVKKQHFLIYPLYLIPRTYRIHPIKFLNCIKLKDVKKNTIETEWQGDTKLYSLIGDNASSNSIQGRFLRLNKEIRSKIDLDNPKEEDLNLGPNEYVEEEAFFLLDTQNGLVIVEYNPSSLNALSSRCTLLINKVLSNCTGSPQNISIAPIPSKDFISSIVGRALIRKQRLEFPDIDLNYLESNGASSTIIRELAEGGDFGVDIVVKHKMAKDASETRMSKLKSVATRLTGHARSYKIYTSEGNFDLIRPNLVFYDIDVDVRSNHEEMVNAVNEEFKQLYEARKHSILDVIADKKTLEDFFE